MNPFTPFMSAFMQGMQMAEPPMWQQEPNTGAWGQSLWRLVAPAGPTQAQHQPQQQAPHAQLLQQFAQQQQQLQQHLQQQRQRFEVEQAQRQAERQRDQRQFMQLQAQLQDQIQRLMPRQTLFPQPAQVLQQPAASGDSDLEEEREQEELERALQLSLQQAQRDEAARASASPAAAPSSSASTSNSSSAAAAAAATPAADSESSSCCSICFDAPPSTLTLCCKVVRVCTPCMRHLLELQRRGDANNRVKCPNCQRPRHAGHWFSAKRVLFDVKV